MEPWYKTVTLRQEVREGRSFSPDEFAIALEQVVAGTAPADYSDPGQFFSRTWFTRALREHTGMVLRRLSGRTVNTSPVLALITQFGGGKTHTLTSLYHLAKAGAKAAKLSGVADLLSGAGVDKAPAARVGVFVGNAWDPEEGRETPWIDLARQLAGDQGVEALGPTARTTPPGTESLTKVFATANAPVLLLFDEVLNFVNRHRDMAEHFYSFIQNLTVSVTGVPQAAAVISLPRSQVEMTEWDQQWQERIAKVVNRVGQDLIANDEAEISEVVRRRLFENLGSVRTHRKVARTYANWCFERKARLPDEWLSVDTSATEAKAREFLMSRFEACYPFHPATLSVFQRKWRALSQFQQTRGALAMLAQWISWAASEQFRKARTEPLITLGSAPLDVSAFRAVVLGQLGETQLDAAIDADIAGPMAHANALDADAQGALRDIHRRVGTTILFESSGGQVNKVAHLPELRFALGEPDVDTTTIDNATAALEKSGFFMRKIGTDGYRIHHQATLKKVVSDRRASLDETTELRPALRKLIEGEFRRAATLPVVFFPEDSAAVQDSARLTLIVLDPETVWEDQVFEHLGDWTKRRGESPRLYPGALVWCIRKPGRELHERAAHWLAWNRVAHEVAEGVLGDGFDHTDRSEVQAKVKEAEAAAKDEVWASYRFVALFDANEHCGIKVIDLGAGHASANRSLCGRILDALRSDALLNESVGAGYIDRNWPPALQDTGAWPLTSLRQSFLDGSLTRLTDPEVILRRQIVEFVTNGEFGLASGAKEDGSYQRLWFAEQVRPEEVQFEPNVFLLTKATAESLRAASKDPEDTVPGPSPVSGPDPIVGTTPRVPEPGRKVSGADQDEQSGESEAESNSEPDSGEEVTIRLAGTVPPEVWNRLGITVLSKMRSGKDICVAIDISASFGSKFAQTTGAELQQILDELDLASRVNVEHSDSEG